MKDYRAFYERLTGGLDRGQKKLIILADQIFTAFIFVSYFAFLSVLLFNQDPFLFRAVVIPACTFLTVTVLRKVIDRKRPYEQWDIEPVIYKETKGKSMPSRHVCSAVIISIMIFLRWPAAGIFYFAVTFCIAVIRVIGGVHYPEDVIAAALLAAAAGMTALL